MKLKEFIEETGISITKFAKRANVSPSTIISIMNGDSDVRLTIALKIEYASKGNVTAHDMIPNKTDERFKELHHIFLSDRVGILDKTTTEPDKTYNVTRQSYSTANCL